MHTPDAGQPAGTPEQPAVSAEQPVGGYRAPSPPPPPPPAQAQAPRKRSGWVIAAIVVVVLALLGCCCMVPFVLTMAGTDSLVADPIYSDGIAVIHVDGIIAGTASSGGLLSSGAQITPEYLIDLMQTADEDPGIEAIVLRIDSPGGTAAASQEIAMEIAHIEKPVIASVGDVAASGAYWIASQCDYIVATPSSAVGSIGVIIQIPNYEGLMEKIGVEYITITQGEFKDAGSPYRSLNATELAMIEEDMEFVYEEFVAGVAEGRDLEVDEVREMANGWVWNAAQGQEMGLVDEMGTYVDALDIAADEAGLSDYEVIYYDQPTPWDLFYWLLTARSDIGVPQLEADTPPLTR